MPVYADADFMPVLRDGVDAELVGECVVVAVAGERQSVVNVHQAVVLIATEEMAVEGDAAVADHFQILRGVFLQACVGHDDLEG